MSTLASGKSNAIEEFRKKITNFLNEYDSDRLNELSKNILQDLGLTGESLTCISNESNIDRPDTILEKLSLLAFTGSKKTLPLFAEAISHAVSRQNVSNKRVKKEIERSKKISSLNRQVLFQSITGRKLLQELIQRRWDSDNENVSQEALSYLSSDLPEFIDNAHKCSDKDYVITSWISATLFQQTIASSDQSVDHILYSFETPTSYDSSFTMTGEIFVPNAISLKIYFDPNSCTETEGDKLTFFKDEELTKRTSHEFSDTQFINFNYDGNKIWFKFIAVTDNRPSDSSYRYGWKFHVKGVFSILGDDRLIDQKRYELISNPEQKGTNLLIRLLASEHEGTKRFAAFTLANITMSSRCKKIMAKELGFLFFLKFCRDDLSRRTCAICISELLEDESNRLKAIEDLSVRPILLNELQAMCTSKDNECRVRAITCISLLATEIKNIPTMLEYHFLEALSQASRTTDARAATAAWTGLRSMAQDKHRLLVYGLNKTKATTSTTAQQLDYSIKMQSNVGSNSVKSMINTVRINIPITAAGMKALRKYRRKSIPLIEQTSSSQTIEKIYIEITVSGEATRSRVGVCPAQETWSLLDDSKKMIGDDSMSVGVEGSRGKVFPSKDAKLKLPQLQWKDNSIIGLSVNVAAKLVEITVDGGSKVTFPMEDEVSSDSSIDWEVGLMFAASLMNGQAMTLNIGQLPMNCSADQASLYEYAKANRLHISPKLQVYFRRSKKFVPISRESAPDLVEVTDSSSITGNTTGGADSSLNIDVDVTLRETLKLLFVSSIRLEAEEEGGAGGGGGATRDIFTSPLLVESQHPMSASCIAMTKRFQWPGASVLLLHFYKIKLGSNSRNHLVFSYLDYDGRQREVKVNEAMLMGAGSSSLSAVDGPLDGAAAAAAADTAVLYTLTIPCNSDSEAVFGVNLELLDRHSWGYKFTVTPKYFEYGLQNTLAVQKSDLRYEQSLRPYENGTHLVRTLVVPSAEAILIKFDEDSRTEATYDYISFYTGCNTNSAPVGYGAYSGNNFPGIGSTPPLLMRGDRFTYLWHTDDSGNEIGWRFSYQAVDHPFTEVSRRPNARVIESPHPCATGITRMEIDMSDTKSKSKIFSMRFHESSWHVGSSDDAVDEAGSSDEEDGGGDARLGKGPWLEVYANQGEDDPQQKSSEIDDNDNMVLVGRQYFEKDLPDMDRKCDLTIPSDRFVIKYFAPDRKGGARVQPWGFQAVVFPCDEMPADWVVDFAHGTGLYGTAGAPSRSQSAHIVFAVSILDELLPLVSSSDEATKQYCGGIMCNLSSSTLRNFMLKSDLRENLFVTLGELMRSSKSWPKIMAVRIIRNLTQESISMSDSSWKADLLAKGLLDRLLTMWCRSDLTTRAETANDVAAVLSLASSDDGSEVASLDSEESIVSTLFKTLNRSLREDCQFSPRAAAAAACTDTTTSGAFDATEAPSSAPNSGRNKQTEHHPSVRKGGGGDKVTGPRFLQVVGMTTPGKPNSLTPIAREQSPLERAMLFDAADSRVTAQKSDLHTITGPRISHVLQLSFPENPAGTAQNPVVTNTLHKDTELALNDLDFDFQGSVPFSESKNNEEVAGSPLLNPLMQKLTFSSPVSNRDNLSLSTATVAREIPLVASFANTVKQKVSSLRDEGLLRSVASALSDLTEFSLGVSGASTSAASSSSSCGSLATSSNLFVQPTYLKDLLGLLAIPNNKVKCSLLRAITNLLLNPDNVAMFRDASAIQNIRYVFELFLSPQKQLHNLSFELLKTLMDQEKASPKGKEETDVLARQVTVKEILLQSNSAAADDSSVAALALSSLPFDSTSLPPPSWDSPCVSDKATRRMYQPLINNKVSISQENVTAIKGFVHPNIISAGSITVTFWLRIKLDTVIDETPQAILQFGVQGNAKIVIRLSSKGCMQVVLYSKNQKLGSNIANILVSSTANGGATNKSEGLKNRCDITGRTVILANTWTFVAVSVDSVKGGSVRLIVNSDVDQELRIPFSPHFAEAFSSVWFLGGLLDTLGSTVATPARGAVENIRLFPHFLSKEEVVKISLFLPLSVFGLQLYFKEAMRRIDELVAAVEGVDFSDLLKLADTPMGGEAEKTAVSIATDKLNYCLNILNLLTLLSRDPECATALTMGSCSKHRLNIAFILELTNSAMMRLKSLSSGSNARLGTSEAGGGGGGLQTKVVESDHPYLPNTDLTWQIEFPEQEDNPVKALKIWFDAKSSTDKTGGVVEVFQDEAKRISVSGPCSGKKREANKYWPTAKNPLYVTGRICWVSFRSDSSVNDEWGWKLYALPGEDPYIARKERVLTSGIGYVLSSEGFPLTQYAPMLTSYTKVKVDKAKVLEVVCHPLSATEKRYDYLRFYKDDSHTEYWGQERYSGPAAEKSFPSCSDPLVIPSNSVVVHFSSDASNQDVGYEIVISEPVPEAVSSEIRLLRQSSELLQALSSNSLNKRDFVEKLLHNGGEGVRLLIHLLDVAQCDAVIVEFIDAVLYSLVADIELLTSILESTKGQKSDTGITQRWLTTMLAMLTSRKEWLQEVYFTDQCINPTPEMAYQMELNFPLATSIRIDFREESSIDGPFELIVSGDPLDAAAVKTYCTGSKFDDFELEGSRVKLALLCKDMTGNGGATMRTAYTVDIIPEFELNLVRLDNIAKIVQGNGLELILRSLKSEDMMTSLTAAKALANLMFVEEGPERVVVLTDGLPALLGLLDGGKDSLVSNSFRLRYSSEVSNSPLITIACNMTIDVTLLKKHPTIYYEAKLQACRGAAIGYLSAQQTTCEGENSQSSSHDDNSACNVYSIFPVLQPKYLLLLDGSKSLLQENRKSTPVIMDNWNDDAIVGVLLDAKTGNIIITINGKLIQINPIKPSITSSSSNISDNRNSWADCVLVPAVYFYEGNPKVTVNFGQEDFMYPPSAKTGAVSVLQACRGMPAPQRNLYKLNKWRTVTWFVRTPDDRNGEAEMLFAGFRPVEPRDKLILTPGEMATARTRAGINHRRQVARGVFGACPLRGVDAVSCALELVRSEDDTTRSWAVKALLRVISEGTFLDMVLADVEALSIIFLSSSSDSKHKEDLELTMKCLGANEYNGLLKALKLYMQPPVVDCLTVESGHPYDSNVDIVTEIYLPGATAMEIFFDPRTCTEAIHDHVTFYASDPRAAPGGGSSTDMLGRFSGDFASAAAGGGWPRLPSSSSSSSSSRPSVNSYDDEEGPMLVKGDRCWLRFISDTSANFWGYRLFARRTNKCRRFDELVKNTPGAVVRESPHPYDNNTEFIEEIVLPAHSTNFFEIRFDSLSSTEPVTDTITFYHKNPALAGSLPFTCAYSGRGFPGTRGMLPLAVETGEASQPRSIWLKFRSDAGTVNWGYRFMVSPVSPPVDPLAEVLKAHPDHCILETSHPLTSALRDTASSEGVVLSDDMFSLARTVSFPGKAAIAIVFDPRSETALSSSSDSTESRLFFIKKKDSLPSISSLITDDGRIDHFRKSQCYPVSASQTPGVGVEVGIGGSQGPKANLTLSSFPDRPLVIPCCEVDVYYRENIASSSALGLWGWRLIAYPLDKFTTDFDTVASMSDAIILQNDFAADNTGPSYIEVITVDFKVDTALLNSKKKVCKVVFHQTTGCLDNDPDFQVIVTLRDPVEFMSCSAEEAEKATVGKYTGRDFLRGPFIVHQLQFWLSIEHPKGEKKKRGFVRIAAAPIEDELEEWATEFGVIAESEHPYENSVDRIVNTFDWEGLEEVEIAFDDRSHLENGYDYLVLLDEEYKETTSSVKFTGLGTYPLVASPLKVKASEAKHLRFFTDSATNFWGYRLALRPVYPKTDSSNKPITSKDNNDLSEILNASKLRSQRLVIAEGLCKCLYYMTLSAALRDSERTLRSQRTGGLPGSSSGSYTISGSITMHGAISLLLSFDENTETEKGRDCLHLYKTSSMKPSEYLLCSSDSDRKDQPAIFSGPFSEPGSWDNLTVPQEALYYSFSSADENANKWGFLMKVKAEFPTVDSDPDYLLKILMNDVTMFRLLLVPLTGQLVPSAGMHLVNVLFKAAENDQLLGKYGNSWINNLFQYGTKELQMLFLATLSEIKRLKRKSISAALLNLVKVTLIAKLMELMMDDNLELQHLAQTVLQDYLDITDTRVEAVALHCLEMFDNEPLRKKALHLLQTQMTNARDSSRLHIVQLDGIRVLKLLLESAESGVRLATMNTMSILLASETTLGIFLDGEEAEDSVALLLGLLSTVSSSTSTSTSADIVSVEVFKLLLSVCTKCGGDSFQASLIDKAVACTPIVPRSIHITKDIRPVWIPLNDSQPDNSLHFEGTRMRRLGASLTSPRSQSVIRSVKPLSSTALSVTGSQKSTQTVGKLASNSCFSVSFWILPESVVLGDGLPIFYWGDFNGGLTAQRRTTVRSELMVRRSRVYFEVTFKTSGEETMVGWVSSEFPSTDAGAAGGFVAKDAFVGCDHTGYSMALKSSKKYFGLLPASAEGVGGGHATYADNKSQAAGDVLGALLDFDTGVISYTLNGSSLSRAFSRAEHGRTAAATDDRSPSGPNWETGFHPAVTIGAGEAVELNLGQKPFAYPPLGYESVLSTGSIPTNYRAENRHTRLPFVVYALDTRTSDSKVLWKEVSTNKRDLLSLSDSAVFCSLLPSMKLSVTLPTHTSERGLACGSEVVLSSGIIYPNTWTHCTVRVSSELKKTYLYFDGTLDSEYDMAGSLRAVSDKTPVAIGAVPSNFEVSPNDRGLWLAGFRHYNYFLEDEDISRDHSSDPLHRVVLRNLLEGVQSDEIAKSCFKSILSDASLIKISDSPNELSISLLALKLLLMFTAVDVDALDKIIGPDICESLVEQLIGTLLEIRCKKQDINFYEWAVVASELLAILSYTLSGRLAIVNHASIWSIVAAVPSKQPSTVGEFSLRFWLEITLANLNFLEFDFQNNIQNYSYQNDVKSLNEKEGVLFFSSRPIQPFSVKNSAVPLDWAFMPFGIMAMYQDPSVFVTLAKSLTLHLDATTTATTTTTAAVKIKSDDVSNDLKIIPAELLGELMSWAIQCFVILTATGVNSKLETRTLESAHNYYSNQDVSGEERDFPETTVRIRIEFDERCATEENYDWLKLWKDSSMQCCIGPPQYSGRESSSWPEAVLPGKSFFWQFHSDGSNEDWGYLMYVTAVSVGLGDTSQVKCDIAKASGAEILIDFASKGNHEDRQAASRALRYLSDIDSVRRELERRNAGGGMEHLMALVRSVRCTVSPAGGGGSASGGPLQCSVSSVPSSEVRGSFPSGTIVTIDRREYFSKEGRPDNNHSGNSRSSRDGYYRVRISEPKEFRGYWISQTNVATSCLNISPLEPDWETLRLLGLLALEKKSRDELVDKGRMRVLLQLAKINDVCCSRAVALALDELSSDLFEWKKASSVFEVVMERDGSAPVLYCSHRLERLPCNRFELSVPVYEGNLEVGLTVAKSELNDNSTGSNMTWVTGLVTGRVDNKITVQWDGTDPSTETFSLDSPDLLSRLTVVRDKRGALVGFDPESWMTIMVDKKSVLEEGVELSVKESSDATKPLLQLVGKQCQCSVGYVAEGRSSNPIIEISGKSPKKILDSKLSFYVILNSSVSEMSFEEDAFQVLVELVSCDDLQTKLAAMSALSRLSQPVQDGSGKLLSSTYLPKLVRSAAMTGIMETMKGRDRD